MSKLNDINILITRPAQQASSLCAKIYEHGGQTVLLPATEIVEPEDIQPAKKLIDNLSHYHLVIFTSPNAVAKVRPLLPSTWPALIKVAAIGSTTATKLEEWGIEVNYLPKEFTSEGLLKLPALQNLAQKKILIIQGAGGRDLLAPTLRERGALVDQAIVYRRCMPREIPKFDPVRTKIDLVICTSAESLQNLCQMLKEHRQWLQNMPLLVASERVAGVARKLGFGDIIIAANPTDATLLEAILHWREYHYGISS